MSKRRICTDVILEIKSKIPEEEKSFLSDLELNFEDASYKAPEQKIQWVRLSDTLQKHIPNPKEDWHFEVLSIFTTKSINELKDIVENG